MRFLEAVLILSGMIIGVGMFGIPFSFAASGFWLGVLELVIATAIVLTLHLLYGEIVLGTEKFHRIPGYVSLYLGKGFGLVSWFSAFFGIIGSLLAYIILGGVFLNSIFGGEVWGEFGWAIVFVAVGALITLFPLKKEATINGVLTDLLIIFILVLAAVLVPGIRSENLSGIYPQNFFLPYGVLLFALTGTGVVAEVATLLNRDRRKTHLAILAGTLIPAVLYFIFALVVVGTSGKATSEEAIGGLLPFVGQGAVVLGAAIGLLAVFTSFIVLAKNFQALLTLDLGVSRLVAWAISFGAAFLFYVLGFKNFIGVVGAVGAFSIGIDAFLVISSHRALVGRRGVRTGTSFALWRILLYVIIIGGVIYELWGII